MSAQIAFVTALILILAALSIVGPYRRMKTSPKGVGPEHGDEASRDLASDYLSDAPLDDPAADRFGRRYFDERVADTIACVRPPRLVLEHGGSERSGRRALVRRTALRPRSLGA
jgi:hypothetical protein